MTSMLPFQLPVHHVPLLLELMVCSHNLCNPSACLSRFLAYHFHCFLFKATSIITNISSLPYSIGYYPHFRTHSPANANVSEAFIRSHSGAILSPDLASVIDTLEEFSDSFSAHFQADLVLAKGNTSWPLVSMAYVVFPKSGFTDCYKATAFVDWLWWTQVDSRAQSIANAHRVALLNDKLKKRLLSVLVDVKCDGKYVNSLHGCVANGVICSDHGQCISKKCFCDDGWQGSQCQTELNENSSSSSDLAIILGVVLPCVAICILLMAIGIFFGIWNYKMKKKKEEWVIDVQEIQIQEHLGVGSFGEVKKGVWRGTEVAVKLIGYSDVVADSRNSFIEEVRIMTTLRHPNVVLFMGACTKPPTLCIVMEYMALGNLHDVLHNELIPDIPDALKIKMAKQAAKGMYFLHSSGSLPPMKPFSTISNVNFFFLTWETFFQALFTEISNL